MLFTPPLTITKTEIDELIAIYDAALTVVAIELQDQSLESGSTRAAQW
jgi:adenosylmethionine-8-amino-7-oxononanoate aminotransferase